MVPKLNLDKLTAYSQGGGSKTPRSPMLVSKPNLQMIPVYEFHFYPEFAIKSHKKPAGPTIQFKGMRELEEERHSQQLQQE